MANLLHKFIALSNGSTTKLGVLLTVFGLLHVHITEKKGLATLVLPNYRGSPTYTKITNMVSTTTVFGLCTCKWGF